MSDILLCYDTSDITSGGVYYYRTNFFSEFLAYNNIKTNTINLRNSNPNYINKYNTKYKIAIFSKPNINNKSHKYSYDYNILEIIDNLKSNNIKIGIDYDDLVFPDYYIHQGDFLSNPDKNTAIKTIDKLREYMPIIYKADFIICSTKALKDTIEQHIANIPIYIYKNRISYELINHNNNNCKTTKLKNILISSGTSTHRYDLKQIDLELFAFLNKYPDVTLNIMGKLDLKDNYLINNLNNINFIKKNKYLNYLKLIKNYDLMIVPLHNNIFNNCKSNIKFIEAAANNIPILATNTDEYNLLKNYCFTTANNNFYLYLEKIYHNPSMLENMTITANSFIQNNLNTKYSSCTNNEDTKLLNFLLKINNI